MKHLKPFLPFLLLLALCFGAFAQQAEYPYTEDIQKFKESDKLNPPPSDAILFMGSSSFTMWTDVQDYFPGYRIINRGFGGSTLLDQVHFIDDVVFPYSPMQVVIYCGENDLAYEDTLTGGAVAERFKKLFGMIREGLPGARITYISMKPSPSRWYMAERLIEGNDDIRRFLETRPNVGFVNVWDAMLNEKGIPEPSIFLDDKLHMNAKGYKIWQKLILPELI